MYNKILPDDKKNTKTPVPIYKILCLILFAVLVLGATTVKDIIYDFVNGIQTDTISEHTSDTGVTIDGLLIKDGEVDGVDISTEAVLTTGNQNIAGVKTFTDATEATSPTTGAVVVTGGLGVSGDSFIADDKAWIFGDDQDCGLVYESASDKLYLSGKDLKLNNDIFFDESGDLVLDSSANDFVFKENANTLLTIKGDGSGILQNDLTSGTFTSGADNLIIGTLSGSGSVDGMTIAAPADGYSSIYFADGAGAGNYAGIIRYYHTSDQFQIYTSATGAGLIIESNGTLSVSPTTNYETLVTDDDVIPNLKKVTDLIAAISTALNDLSDVTITGAAQGDVLYYNGSAWVNLAAGTSGKFLKTQGAGANPVWDTPAGAGDMQKATYDSDTDDKIDAAAGGTDLDTSGSTGVPSISAGTWSVAATLAHELGGLEADVSAYSGLIKISGGTTSQAVAGTDYAATRTGVYRTIWIDAGAMVPCTTNGAEAGTNEYATNDIEWDYFAFDGGATEERVQFKLSMPGEWNGGTVKVKFYWSSATGSTTGDTVQWGIKAGALDDSDVIDTALGTAQTVSDALTADNGTDLQISSATAALTIAGTPGVDEIITFEIYRDTDGTDDMTEDAWLLGVKIQYQENATEPSAW